MKLVRYLGPGAATYVGVVDGDLIVPVGRGSAEATQGALLALAMAGPARTPAAIAEPVPYDDARVLAPVPNPPSIRDFYAFEAHVATANRGRGRDVPPAWYDQPVFYFTNPAAVVGPGDDVRTPAGCEALDYELEVAAVIGVDCEDVDAADAMSVVAGFTIMNDWSARDIQRAEMAVGLGPAKGKDFATSLGPMLVTLDEFGGPPDRPEAQMTATVNGEEWSRGRLGSIHYSWPEMIERAARSTRLRAGDVIGSGTVGTGCILELAIAHGSDGDAGPYRWLQPGDEVALAVEHMGVLANRVV